MSKSVRLAHTSTDTLTDNVSSREQRARGQQGKSQEAFVVDCCITNRTWTRSRIFPRPSKSYPAVEILYSSIYAAPTRCFISCNVLWGQIRDFPDRSHDTEDSVIC
jgi:hypothetical protein